MKNITLKYAWFFLIGFSLPVAAQTSGPTDYSLRSCVQYALQNNQTVKNAVIDSKISQEKIAQEKSYGLPQVRADVNYTHNFKVQNVILENGIVPAFTSPDIPLGAVLAFPLQLKNQLIPSLNVNQLIFDQSFLTALKASKTYQELVEKQVNRTKIEVAESVTKAYYGVLVSQRQQNFLDVALARADTLYRETQGRFRSGVARKIDVDRVEVSLNNLKQEREKAARIVALNKALLTFQMNTSISTDFSLTDTLNENVFAEVLASPNQTTANYSDRVEYNILQTQEKLNQLNIKNIKAGYYPRLSAFGTTGYNPAATHIGDIVQGSRWFNYTYVGLRLEIPIFDGFNKSHQIQQMRLEDEKHQNTTQRLERNIDLEVKQAQINLDNSLESLKIQKRNLELAQENVRILKIENEKGITLNIEVINAETSLKESQNSYYNALYNALINKVDVEKATGRLLTE